MNLKIFFVQNLQPTCPLGYHRGFFTFGPGNRINQGYTESVEGRLRIINTIRAAFTVAMGCVLSAVVLLEVK